jgi:Xaa-Pro aminopeptidase
MIEGIVEKVKTSLESSDYDAVLVFGPDNVQYLTGAHLPFPYSYPERFIAVFWPRKGEPTCVCPAEWEPSLSELSWMKGTWRYVEEPGNPEAILEPLSELVRAMRRTTGKIGLDMDRVSAGLFDSLHGSISGFEIVACDSWLKELRMTKTPGEVELLEDVAYRTDHGIFGAAHHVLVTSVRSEMSLSEELRVHSMEMELDVVGHHSVSQTASGENAKKFWPLAPKFGLGYAKHLNPGEYVRMEMRASLDGYWSDASRMMTMGEPTEAQSKAYNAIVALREAALGQMKLGASCNYVYEFVKKKAVELGVELVPKLGVGHGVGVTTREPPFLNAVDDTELRPGMVLVLDPMIYGPEREILRSKDTVVVTEEGCRVVGWYKDWREPYVANYTL